ncbi:diguanylate cyclase [Nocardia sp. NPDC057668]|uniref:GGDEF domain-containing protein n=1 Tax=Nocardia sp. NPDC057668 TaxID=3346202 RepID=UPI00366C7868
MLESHSTVPLQRAVVGMGGLLFAVIAVAASFSSAGPRHLAGDVIMLGIALGALLWALRWWLLPWPSQRESLLMFAAADVMITVACLQDSDRVYGALGAMLLVVTGGYLTFFHSPKVLAAHAAWSLLSVLVLSARMVAGSGDFPLAVVVVLTMVSAVVVTLPSLQFMFWLVRVESLSDPLTRLLNRRGLEFQLSGMFGVRDRPGICVMVADLDQFKGVNDLLGHPAGDRVLIRTAELLSSLAGDGMVVSRTGGEEFALVGYLDPQAALAQAETVRHAVAADPDIPVTVSIGIAAYDGRIGPRPTPDELLRRADTAMYRAKRGGGNQVFVCDRTSPPVRGR